MTRQPKLKAASVPARPDAVDVVGKRSARFGAGCPYSTSLIEGSRLSGWVPVEIAPIQPTNGNPFGSALVFRICTVNRSRA